MSLMSSNYTTNSYTIIPFYSQSNQSLYPLSYMELLTIQIPTLLSPPLHYFHCHCSLLQNPIHATCHDQGILLREESKTSSYFLTFSKQLKVEFYSSKELEIAEPGSKFNPLVSFDHQQKTKLKLELLDSYLGSIFQTFLQNKLYFRGFHRLFRPIKKLGMGNYACVYVAERIQDKKQFAVKAFSKQNINARTEGLSSLDNEVSILWKFKHPNLLHLQQVYQSSNSIYLVLGLLQGGELHKHTLSRPLIRAVMAGLLQGLAELARHDIVHRDIKPDNIIFKDESKKEVVIVDFGLATKISKKQLYPHCGTPGYIAPEVFYEKGSVSTKNDMFSLGVIFHMLLTKKALFVPQPCPQQQLYKQMLLLNRACQINLAAPLYQDLSQEEKELLEGLLEKEEKKRWSAEEGLESAYIRGKGKGRFLDEKSQDVDKLKLKINYQTH